jgi:hypothetical protein
MGRIIKVPERCRGHRLGRVGRRGYNDVGGCDGRATGGGGGGAAAAATGNKDSDECGGRRREGEGNEK